MKNITYLTLFFNILLLSVAVRMPSLHTAWKTKSTSNSDPYVDNSNSNENTFKPYDKTHSSDVEQLYDAYNQLHTLAQDFQKPFDSPAVCVVGHQTSGKSALIEALMGFQFNQVGGGTKTRRPIALRMQYNPACSTPVCYLTMENGNEELKSLQDIQAYIELENKRLERDPSRCYDSKEINIRVEYRYCPNMIIIDTPGMLHAPKGTNLNPQQRALARAAKEAEALVLSKLKCQDYIILCVEDTTDWKHATTRNVVMQADPMLARTVLVTTKLDTKLPQFSESVDLDDFLRAPVVHKLYPDLYGGPFYTSVPSGRVGLSSGFNSNEDFVDEVMATEERDRSSIAMKLDKGPIPKSMNALRNVGITRLRTFLESKVEECYRRNVAKIVPMLQTEYRKAEDKLALVDEELSSLSLEKLKEGANAFREKFAKELENSIHGTARASPAIWGENLNTEQMNAGSYLAESHLKSEMWQRLLDVEVGNAQHKLFGGAQYHRALREFSAAVRHMSLTSVSEDEIANAAGMGDMHDGVNFMRAACVLAMNKAHTTFDPMLESLRSRAVHVMRRLFPLVQSMMQSDYGRTSASISTCIPHQMLSKPFLDTVKRIYDKFVHDQMEYCIQKCRDDLQGMTRFVTWDVDGRGGSSALYRSMPTPKRMVEIYNIALEKRAKGNSKESTKSNKSSGISVKSTSSKAESVEDKIYNQWLSANGNVDSSGSSLDMKNIVSENAYNNRMIEKSSGWGEDDVQVTDYYDLLQLTEEMLAGRNANRTNTVVTALVLYIVRSWRDHFARSVAMKFNCFFLLPFIDEFPIYFRNELDKLYDEENNAIGAGELFDIREARRELQKTRQVLLAECDANAKLQQRFDKISAQLRSYPQNSDSSNDEDTSSYGLYHRKSKKDATNDGSHKDTSYGSENLENV